MNDCQCLPLGVDGEEFAGRHCFVVPEMPENSNNLRTIIRSTMPTGKEQWTVTASNTGRTLSKFVWHTWKKHKNLAIQRSSDWIAALLLSLLFFICVVKITKASSWSSEWNLHHAVRHMKGARQCWLYSCSLEHLQPQKPASFLTTVGWAGLSRFIASWQSMVALSSWHSQLRMPWSKFLQYAWPITI